MNKKLKVLVVDDATFMTKAISDLLESDPDIEVIGVANNGLEGLEKIKELKPDVITLDIDMPIMDGLQAVRHIMIESPVPIVVLSSLFSDGSITFEALRLGVVDFVAKPSGAISSDIHTAKQHIVDRIKLASEVNFQNIRRVRVNKQKKDEGLADLYGFHPLDYIIAIGTSLTGPNTFIRLMTRISAGLPAAAVILLEISPKILAAFAEKFNEFVHWKIEVARQGTVLEQGVCYIQSNMSSLTVGLNENGDPCFQLGERVEKPLDTFFKSAAEVFRENTVGVLLTGYGDDGSDGFAVIREKSGKTIAQSADTCVYPNLTDTAIKRKRVDVVAEEAQLADAIESVIR
ncbi:MAG: chemotaxis protein CheB [Candidatus Electrothrix scaldis]|nr:MAG: chemotaxis protein CheB [Candidatus Electrothrix sp. GW3-3]